MQLTDFEFAKFVKRCSPTHHLDINPKPPSNQPTNQPYRYNPRGTGEISYMQFNDNVGRAIHPAETGHLMLRAGSQHHGRPDTPHIAAWVEKSFAERMLSEFHSIDQVFAHLDTDDSGYVSTSEFIEGLKHLGIKLTPDDYQSLANAYDPSNDGRISLADFRHRFHDIMGTVKSNSGPPNGAASGPVPRPGPAVTKGMHRTKNLVTAAAAQRQLAEKIIAKYTKAQHAFRAFDYESSGHVSRDEFRKALDMIGISMKDTEFKELADQYDTDKSGFISYTEFNNKVGELLHPSQHGLMMRPGGSHKHTGGHGAYTTQRARARPTHTFALAHTHTHTPMNS